MRSSSGTITQPRRSCRHKARNRSWTLRSYAMYDTPPYDALKMPSHPAEQQSLYAGAGLGSRASSDAAVVRQRHDVILRWPPAAVAVQFQSGWTTRRSTRFPMARRGSRGWRSVRPRRPRSWPAASMMASLKRSPRPTCQRGFPATTRSRHRRRAALGPSRWRPGGARSRRSASTSTIIGCRDQTRSRASVYGFDLAYVKAIGDINSRVAARTVRDREVLVRGLAHRLNRIANIVLLQKHVGLWQSARIGARELRHGRRLHRRLRREIPLSFLETDHGDSSGEPSTVIGGRIPTKTGRPCHYTAGPDDPSTHTVLGASAAAVLIPISGDRAGLRTTSVTEPGGDTDVVGFSHAAVENGFSRVFSGIHFFRAVADGYRQGTSIGRTGRATPASRPIGPSALRAGLGPLRSLGGLVESVGRRKSALGMAIARTRPWASRFSAAS